MVHTSVKQMFRQLIVAVAALSIVLLGASVVSAWAEPTLAPPNGNVAAPINVSATAQTKAGALVVQRGLTAQMPVGVNGYGVTGRTSSATNGGVIGYSANGAVYGILGHANAYSLFGNGQIRTTNAVVAGGAIAAGTALTAGTAVTAGTSVTAPRFCIGTSCITQWPSQPTGYIYGGHYALRENNECDQNPATGDCSCPAGTDGNRAGWQIDYADSSSSGDDFVIMICFGR